MKPPSKKDRKGPKGLPAANDLKRAGALVAGSRRTDAFKDALVRAMKDIETEVIGNKGVYPLNEGRLSPTEVARRAGVVVNSLYHVRHGELMTDVGVFVNRMLAFAPVKRTASEAGRTWEELYREIADNYRADGLEWQSDRARRESAEERISELESSIAAHLQTIDRLANQITSLTKGRVVPIESIKGEH